MSWAVRWEDETAEALVDLARHDRGTAERIRQRLRQFAETGQGNIKELEGRRDEWRLRVGTWRVTFTFDQPSHTIIVLLLELRGRAYRD